MAEYVALDVETTGLDPQRDEIIEIGLVRFDAEGETESYTTLIDPDCPVPYSIQRLTGITGEALAGAPRKDQVLHPVVEFIGNRAIVGQNLAFDLAFLSRSGITFHNSTYDTIELAKVLLPTLSRRNLASLAQHLGVPLPVHHRALPDACGAMGIFLALRSIAFDLPQGVLAALLRVVTNHEWPLASFFLEIARERGDTSFLAPKPPHQVVEDVASLSIHDRSHPALSAIEKPIAPDLKRIADFLGADGPLSNSFPGFEYRGEQVQMAQAVAQAFNEGRHLLAEAGTGTGKSLAYLSPSAMMAQQNHVPVVISTNTINLQEQLVNKDIPELIRALASELNQSNGITPTSVGQNDSTASLRVAQLKGRANYLCLRRFASSLGSLQSMEEASFTARLLVWLASTTTGDRAEVAINSRENELWNRVSAQEGNCLSGPCSYVNSGLCFLYRARERAASSHMVVVNHALLVSDIVRDGAVLPDHDYLVIDEAHHLEDVATEQMGYRVALRDLADYLDHLSRPGGGGRPQGLLSTVQGLLTQEGSPLYRGGALAQRIDSLHGKVSSTRSRGELLYQILGRILNTHGEDSGGYSRRLRITPNVRKHEVWRDLEQAWENLHLSLEELERDLSRVAGAIEELAREKEDPWVDLLTEVAAALPAGSIIHRQMTTFISAPDPDGIYWLESQNQGQSPLMCAAPLDVSAALDKLLFSKRKSVVLTSATLQTEGNFEYIKGRLGLKAPEELAVGSPFEYLNTTLIYTPKDMPGPERPGYMETLDRALVEMCSATGGRALVLFTSHSALQRAYNSVKEPLGRADIQVLGQTVDGTPAYILSTFKSQPRTVLMGTSSFWEGVDVVGDALSLLVITRLPFTVPTDPVFAARSQQFSDPFNQFAIPQAILRFRQGFGRLIRSSNDRGAVVILDSRVLTKGYGGAFLNSLPLCTVVKGPLKDAPSTLQSWLGN